MIVGILLAAGLSSRFGSNKLLHELEGVPVVVRAAQCLAPLQQNLVVIPNESSTLYGVLQQDPVGVLRPTLTTVFVASQALGSGSMQTSTLGLTLGSDPVRGLTPKLIPDTPPNLSRLPSLSLSLRTGLMGSAYASGWVIALGDMPWVQPSTVAALREALELGAEIAVPRYHGARGNPVGFSRRYWHELIALQGDEGARSLLQRHITSITWVDVEDEGILRDVDLPADALQNS
jgi:CTP:molybdopterin cytidylyltransferase MocA